MKATVAQITITICLILIILTSCESHEQKSNDAFDQFKQEKMMASDSIAVTVDSSQAAGKNLTEKINETINEWDKFKNHIEKKILANENKVKKIKQTPEASVKFLKKIVHLEKDNNDLKNQLKEYEEQVKINLEKFKEKINLQADDIDAKLKDLSASKNK